MKELLSEKNFESRMDIYIDKLNNSPEIKTLQILLDKLKEDWPNDSSITYNRVQRDIKKFLDEKGISDNSPIEALKRWVKKYYMPISVRDFFCDNCLDILFDYPNIYIKAMPYEAEKVGHLIRTNYSNLCPFVIAEYDTVLIRFKEEQKFNQFKEIFNEFLQVKPEDEE